MEKTKEHMTQEIEEIYYRQADTVYRICYLYLKNTSDAEDAVQAVFLKLMEHTPAFENIGHEKAWLLVTAANHCKNMLRHWWRKSVGLESLPEQGEEPTIDETLEQVLRLSPKYKTVIYLYYYEGYACAEIAELLHQKESTVRSCLCRGRKLLKLQIGGEEA